MLPCDQSSAKHKVRNQVTPKIARSPNQQGRNFQRQVHAEPVRKQAQGGEGWGGSDLLRFETFMSNSELARANMLDMLGKESNLESTSPGSLT
jgi:hypothetical protein